MTNASCGKSVADEAAIDWSRPLQAWSKDEMTNFLLLAMNLINAAEIARDGGKILRQRKPEFDDAIPSGREICADAAAAPERGSDSIAALAAERATPTARDALHRFS
jgi:hypothetical protein